jgi:hypothetical protein
MKIRLFALAHGRSGDKGDSANIGIVARREEWYGFLEKELTAERVAQYLAPLAQGPVERYELPNLAALNFLVHRALGGGGSRSLRLDAQGKTYAQALLKLPLEVDETLETELHEHWQGRIPDYCRIPQE